jgi:2,4-dienoyl-CoA reductase (NADPH2)
VATAATPTNHSARRRRARRDAHGIPRALTKAEIHVLIDAFGQAARHVKAGGYDGVDLSCWGGHLTEQFLSPVSNRRTDEYGGSLENRLRFCLETLEAVRAAVGPDLIVGARLPGDQMVPGGLTLEDTQAIAARLAGTGWLDYVTVSGASTEGYRLSPTSRPRTTPRSGSTIASRRP